MPISALQKFFCQLAFLMLVLLPLLSSLSSEGGEWKIPNAPLLTKWSRDVSADNPLPAHPNPQFMREEWISLNGLWDYAVLPKSFENPPAQYEEKILVPFPIESALSGVMSSLQPDQRLWYKRSFFIPNEWRNKRVILHFQAVDWEANVWLNGRLLGVHRGGYDSFSFDITDYLKSENPQELIVAVWDPTDSHWQMRGKQSLHPEGCFYTACSGIWQMVWLEAVPETHIEELKIQTNFSSRKGKIVLEVSGRMPPSHKARLKVRILDGGKIISTGEAIYEVPAPVRENLVEFLKAMSVWFPLTIKMEINDVKLWSPEEPHLYDLLLELNDEEAKTTDKVRSYFGVREVSKGKDEFGNVVFLLNGKPYYMVGALDQGYWPDGIYTAPTDEALRYDIECAKRLGLNSVRKHVKIEPQRWYYWCDRLGLLVLQDMPSGGQGDCLSDKSISPEAESQWQTEAMSIIYQLRNHPSIVMWINFNEGWGQFDTIKNAKWVKELDSSRLVDEASGFAWHGGGDAIDSHGGHPPKDPQRISITSEDGGWGALAEGHCWNPSRAWAYVTYEPETFKPVAGNNPPLPPLTDKAKEWLTQWIGRFYQRFWQHKNEDGRSGYFYTQLTDVETECNGLLSYDRALFKVGPEKIRDKIRGKIPKIKKFLLPCAQISPISWRYTENPPPADWYKPDFDDSGWSVGKAGSGATGTPGARVGTEWRSSDIWLRREFILPKLSEVEVGRIRLRIHHDEDVEVYINGALAFKEGGFLTDYDDVEIYKEAISALKEGRNIIAVHCHQTVGGQYIDVGILLAE